MRINRGIGKDQERDMDHAVEPGALPIVRLDVCSLFHQFGMLGDQILHDVRVCQC